ncbi:hypothetical protein [Polaribacter vadi]|uniref:hypothetical protein n=1 Tax=Polaribacter vadi TaxID=1774273 RepID=UPI0030EE0134|tara:strand:+ start:10482 stop:10958 length:477 start_codon:yes stop_codon:yes gene_type:complete
MKYTNAEFKASTRLQNYEKEIIKHFETEQVYEIKKLQQTFKNRASLSTIKSIAEHSTQINYNDSIIFDANIKLAEIAYTVTGGNVDGIWVGSDNGTLPSGTVFSARLSNTYSFDVEVNNGPGNWTININRIFVYGEGERTPIQPSPTDENSVTVYTQN